MTDFPDLLLLRLDALALDIEKVRVAVKRAQERGQLLAEARKQLRSVRDGIRTVKDHVDRLADAIGDDRAVADAFGAYDRDLYNDLQTTPDLVEDVRKSVQDTIRLLGRAASTAVSLTDRSLELELEQSLETRCNGLTVKLEQLRKEVEATRPDERRRQWTRYHELLDSQARTAFVEYVDFLGGLTVRDTGLDDRVCEMTDVLLTRFKTVTRRSLPLPARHAALATTLDSVVLLGFPEWSIWGIPLVGHEVGLAYAKDYGATRIEFLNEYAETYLGSVDPATGEDSASAREYVEQLLADVFATYTLGLSYACAALLLRLSPRHDEVPRRGVPRDIDRARVIMLTLRTGWRRAPQPGGSFSDAVGTLNDIWTGAAKAYAGPRQAEAAAAEVEGPPPDEDWVDDFAARAVEEFTGRPIRPFDNDRWVASDLWCKALHEGGADPGWAPADDAVPDVLTAAWRLRLADASKAGKLAEEVMTRWSTAKKGPVR